MSVCCDKLGKQSVGQQTDSEQTVTRQCKVSTSWHGQYITKPAQNQPVQSQCTDCDKVSTGPESSLRHSQYKATKARHIGKVSPKSMNPLIQSQYKVNAIGSTMPGHMGKARAKSAQGTKGNTMPSREEHAHPP